MTESLQNWVLGVMEAAITARGDSKDMGPAAAAIRVCWCNA